MKRGTALAGILALTFALATPALAAGNEDDLTVIKRAVRGGHAEEPGQCLNWFKLVITDKSSRKDVVKVNLPIFVVGSSGHCSKDKHQPRGKDHAGARGLKKLGPLTLLEIVGDGAKIKISLE